MIGCPFSQPTSSVPVCPCSLRPGANRWRWLPRQPSSLRLQPYRLFSLSPATPSLSVWSTVSTGQAETRPALASWPRSSKSRLQIAQELIPNAEALAFLANPNNPITESATREMQLAAATLGQRLFVLKASTRAEIDAAFLEFAGRRVGGVLPQGDGFLFGQRDQIISLAAQHAIPGIYSQREFVTAGGLMSYGSSITDGYRQIGTYAARILKGERPSDLPIQQSTKVDLVINLKTAKTLGLNIPLSLLGRANEVIE